VLEQVDAGMAADEAGAAGDQDCFISAHDWLPATIASRRASRRL
jgi:hypothetical protein